MTILPEGVTTHRMRVPDDLEFLYTVYASTRTDEMAIVPWTEGQKSEFLRMQFNAQHIHYTQHYPDAAYEIILLNDAPIGRIYTAQLPDELRLIEVTLLPSYRNRGIGTALMHRLIEQAQSLHLPIRLHVESFNPAYRLYTRLGFYHLEDRGIYQFMEWKGENATDH
jgi:ribosomal protein S18 acetylase RimI-like enzyme